MNEQAPHHPPLTLTRIALAVALTAVAGYVDAFGYLSFGHVYTAQMSGNTVLIAVHGGHGEVSSALIHAYTVGVFMFGLLVSSIGIELGLRRGIRRVLALTLAIEAACLATVAVWGMPLLQAASIGTAKAPGWPLYALIALTSVGLGIQNTTLRMAGILSIFTTHVTGTLTRASEQFVLYLLPRSGIRSRPALAEAVFSAGIWLAFFLGAFLSSELLSPSDSAKVLMLPIAVLIVVIAADLRWPFAMPRPLSV